MFSCTTELISSSNQSRSPQNEPYDSSEHLSAPDDNGMSISNPDYTSEDEWSLLPVPLTVYECVQQNQAAQNAEKQAQHTAVQRRQHAVQIQSAEHHFDGQIDKKRGVKRGPYRVGGLSKHTVQRKKRKVQQSIEVARQSLNSARVVYHLEDIDEEAKCKDRLMQLSLDSFFTAHACTRKGDEGGQDKEEEEEKEEESKYVSTDRAKKYK
jgi:hypothetical protein